METSAIQFAQLYEIMKYANMVGVCERLEERIGRGGNAHASRQISTNKLSVRQEEPFKKWLVHESSVSY